MSDIIESIKQGAGQVLSGIDQKGQIKSAIDGIRGQWSELERRRKTSQLGNEIKSLQNEMKQLTEALGLQTLSLFDVGKIAHPELTRLCDRINELRSDVEQKKAELATLKVASQTRCPQCQTEVPGSAEFCPKCGQRLQPVPAAEPAAASAAQRRVVVRFRCPRCKTILPSEAGFCPTCGVKIRRPQASAPERFCASCGAAMDVKAHFCPICGHAATQGG
jgi:rRNA maturation endonuclease Nob1